ncbi:glucose-inhibited division protein A, partial [Marinobacter sp. ELB17]
CGQQLKFFFKRYTKQIVMLLIRAINKCVDLWITL